jgi:hypothetical protein
MFEEVKEMIDSTIYTNGRGEVTAQNVNLAMHGMVDATEEKFGEVETNVADVTNRVAELEQNGSSGNAGGRGPLRVWINEENTPEQVAENASTYTALKNNIAQQVCFVSTPIIDPDTLEAVVYASYSVESIQRADSGNGFYLAKQFITDNGGTVGASNIAILLLEDGTLEYVS